MGFRWTVLTPLSWFIDTHCRWGLGPRGRRLDEHEVKGYIRPTLLTRESTREHALFNSSLGQHITKRTEIKPALPFRGKTGKGGLTG